MLGRECPEAVLPDRVFNLPTFSQLLIVTKVLWLCLSVSLSLSRHALFVGFFMCWPMCVRGGQRFFQLSLAQRRGVTDTQRAHTWFLTRRVPERTGTVAHVRCCAARFIAPGSWRWQTGSTVFLVQVPRKTRGKVLAKDAIRSLSVRINARPGIVMEVFVPNKQSRAL